MCKQIAMFFFQSIYKPLNIVGFVFLFILIHFPALAQEKKQFTVVIDPGHGGKDSGALGKISKEKDIVLSISLKLGKLIQENLPLVKVIYTRSTDVFIELNKRAEIANNNHADLFISIHANSIKKPSIYGTETFVMGLHKTSGNLEVAMKENAVIELEEDYSAKYQGYDPNSAESFIIFSLMQNTFIDQSLKLASIIQTEFSEKAQRANRGVKQAGFLVLWNTTMPSVLIETGFLSHTQEEKFMTSEQGQNILSSAIYRAVKNYINQINPFNEQQQVFSHPPFQKNDSIPAPPTDNKIYFKIQITSSSNQVQGNEMVFKGLSNIEELFLDNMYKYTYGNCNTFKEIKKLQKDILEKFPDSFIIAIKNGERMQLNEAIKEAGE